MSVGEQTSLCAEIVTNCNNILLRKWQSVSNFHLQLQDQFFCQSSSATFENNYSVFFTNWPLGGYMITATQLEKNDYSKLYK